MSRLTQANPLTLGLALALVVAAACAVGLGWCCYRLLVDRGHLLLAAEHAEETPFRAMRRGLRAGSFVSDFALPGLDGRVVAFTELLGGPLLLAFVRGDCLYSRVFVRELSGLGRECEEPLLVVIVSGKITDPEIVGLVSRLPGPVLLDPAGQVARLMRVSLTPAGYQVDHGRQIVGPLLIGPAELLAAARGGDDPEAGTLPLAGTPMPKDASPWLAPLVAGDLAPRFTLPTTDGATWALQDHRGSTLGLVFVDPGCPPCRPLLAALSQHDAASFLVVSRGDAEENRRLRASLGLTAPVVMQRNREVARAYHALATPAAYVIDERGAIASGPALGAEAVMALLAQHNLGGVAMEETRAAGNPPATLATAIGG